MYSNLKYFSTCSSHFTGWEPSNLYKSLKLRSRPAITKILVKNWNGYRSVNIAQNLYYNLFLEMEQPFCIFPCGINPDLGTGISDSRCNYPVVTKKFWKKKRDDFKSTISPSSRLQFNYFFFWTWVFFHKESKSAIRFYRVFPKTYRSDLQTRRPRKFLQKIKKFSTFSQESALIPLVIDLIWKYMRNIHKPKNNQK